MLNLPMVILFAVLGENRLVWSPFVSQGIAV
jgi:hypothetical protein